MARDPRTLGYIRVSTEEQDTEKNKADILRLANEKHLGQVEWIEEKVSGTKHWKERRLGDAFISLHKGDTIIVPELSRLARSTLQILELMQEARKRGVAIYAVKGSWSLNGSMESKIVLHMLAMVAEIERDLISERTKEALRVRKAAGIRLGRPRGPGKSKLDHHGEEIVALLRNGSTKAYVAKKYGTSSANLHNWIKKNGLDIEPRL